jgi:hypothetical protein
MLAYIADKQIRCLASFNLSVNAWQNDQGYFLRSSPYVPTAWRSADKRDYIMFANPRLFNASFGPSEEALHAIILHEANHLRDYTAMDARELATFGADYALNYTFLIEYEHATDMKVMRMGFGDGLAAYRRWVYTKLDPSELATKQLEYYTPEQIEQWQSEQPSPLPAYSPCEQQLN